jgi:hypothetical protein
VRAVAIDLVLSAIQYVSRGGDRILVVGSVDRVYATVNLIKILQDWVATLVLVITMYIVDVTG